MATSARVLFYAPSLADDSRIETAIEIAAGRLSPDAYGNQWGDAIACLAGHLLLSSPLAGDGLSRGPVTSEKAGDIARNYGSLAATSLEDADLARTAPGLQLLSLRRSRGTVGFGVLS